MYTNQKTIYQIQTDLNYINIEYPNLYKRIQHVTSLTRQLQIKYRYLADLITNESREPAPRFIKESVLNILILEVDKLRQTPHFNIFLNLLNNNEHNDAPEIFLMILGAKPESVINNAIIN